MLDFIILLLVFGAVYGVFLFAHKHGWLPDVSCR